MAKFKAGASGNPKGKIKGTSNKVTAEARALFIDILAGEVQHIPKQLEILRKEDANLYLKSLSSFMQYFIPKMTEQEITVTDTTLTTPKWFDETKDIE